MQIYNLFPINDKAGISGSVPGLERYGLWSDPILITRDTRRIMKYETDVTIGVTSY